MPIKTLDETHPNLTPEQGMPNSMESRAVVNSTGSTANTLLTVVYSSESQVKSPGTLLKSMGRDLLAARELAWRLFVRDIAAQYRQSFLGLFWAFLPPLMTALIFIVLNAQQVVNLGPIDIPYPLFAVVGTMLWQTFVEGLNAPLKSVILAKPMLVKINFPHEALIVSGIYTVLFNFAIKAAIIAILLALFQVPPTLALVAAMLAVLVLVLLGIGMGLLLTPLGVLYNDVASGLPVVVQLLFFLTPVVYAPPQRFPFSLVATLNPISPPLLAARDWVTKGTFADPLSLTLVAGLGVLLLFVAWVIYRLALPIVIERMSA